MTDLSLFPELAEPAPQLLTGDDVVTRGTAAAWATFSTDGLYRYVLGRVWNPDGTLLVVCMQNPSDADETKLDPTTIRVQGFAKRDRFGGWLAVNMYAYRSTDPRALRHVADPVGPRNDEAIVEACDRPMLAQVVAAWGRPTTAAMRRRVAKVRALPVRRYNWYTFGSLTVEGHPRHPLYLRSDTPLQEWTVA